MGLVIGTGFEEQVCLTCVTCYGSCTGPAAEVLGEIWERGVLGVACCVGVTQQLVGLWTALAWHWTKVTRLNLTHFSCHVQKCATMLLFKQKECGRNNE